MGKYKFKLNSGLTSLMLSRPNCSIEFRDGKFSTDSNNVCAYLRNHPAFGKLFTEEKIVEEKTTKATK